MNSFIRTCGLAALAVMLVAPGAPAHAQGKAGFDVLFKGRFGFNPGGAADNLTNRMIGMGIDVGYATPVGRFACEVGFQYKPGDQYAYDVTSAPMEPGTVFRPVTSANAAFTNGIFAGDVRRNSMQGATVRLSYEYAFSSDMCFRGGVQLFGAQFRQQVLGTMMYADPNDPPSGPSATQGWVTDSYGGSYLKSDAAPSPFVGVGWRLGPNSGFEANLLCLSYKTLDYVHWGGTGSTYTGGASNNNPGFNNRKDYFEEGSSMVPHLEIAYAFRF